MANSMDNIVIRYGVSDADFREKNELKKIKECKLSDFIKLDKKNLLPFEQKLQESLIELYKLNGKEPPLYKKFPLSPSRKRLVIDCTTTGEISRDLADKEYIAHYTYDEHVIGFDRLEEKMDASVFIIALAHELKHAEQYTSQLRSRLEKSNNYQKQQLSFISEAEAYTFSTLLEDRLGIEPPSAFLQHYRKLLKEMGGDQFSAEANLFRNILRRLPYDNMYKMEYDRIWPISPEDDGIMSLPESLENDVTRKYQLMFVLSNWYVPKESTTPESLLITLIQQKQFKEAVGLVEKHPNLCLIPEGTRLARRLMDANDPALMDGYLNVAVKQSKIKKEKESLSLLDSPAFLSFMFWTTGVNHKISKEEQLSLLPMGKVLIKHLSEEGYNDAMMRDFLKEQMEFKNSDLVSGMLECRDANNKPYVSEALRAEFGQNKKGGAALKKRLSKNSRGK